MGGVFGGACGAFLVRVVVLRVLRRGRGGGGGGFRKGGSFIAASVPRDRWGWFSGLRKRHMCINIMIDVAKMMHWEGRHSWWAF